MPLRAEDAATPDVDQPRNAEAISKHIHENCFRGHGRPEGLFSAGIIRARPARVPVAWFLKKAVNSLPAARSRTEINR